MPWSVERIEKIDKLELQLRKATMLAESNLVSPLYVQMLEHIINLAPGIALTQGFW